MLATAWWSDPPCIQVLLPLRARSPASWLPLRSRRIWILWEAACWLLRRLRRIWILWETACWRQLGGLTRLAFRFCCRFAPDRQQAGSHVDHGGCGPCGRQLAGSYIGCGGYGSCGRQLAGSYVGCGVAGCIDSSAPELLFLLAADSCLLPAVVSAWPADVVPLDWRPFHYRCCCPNHGRQS